MSAVVHIGEGYYADNDTRYVFLDGGACKKISDCYASLQQQLSIPAYFGRNLDALEEVLDDLEWIKEKKINIIILDTPTFLQNDLAKKNAFLEVLHKAGNKKLTIVHLGKTPGR